MSAASVLALGFLVGLCRASEAADPVFDARGFQPNRDFFNELPFEHIDPMTGNVLLTFTDLVLPGNAGFDLRIQRTYNSKIWDQYTNAGGSTLDEDTWAGIGWRLHLGRVLNPTDVSPGPIIEMPDGSRHQLYLHMDGNANHYITKDYWTYDNVFQFPVLRLPNGLKYTFGHSQGGPFYVTKIEDPFGNKVIVNYASPPAPADVISSISQQLVGGQTRTITFSYNATLPGPGGGAQAAGSLATMTFNGRTWTYTQQVANVLSYTQLMEVKPPVGPSWRFTYDDTNPQTLYLLNHVDTPNGGDIDYTYTAQVFHIGGSVLFSPALIQRQISGRSVPSGTWSYAYSSSPAQNQTVITSPCNKTTYTFLGIGSDTNQDPWAIGAMANRTTSSTSGTTFETEALTWTSSVPISNEPEGGFPPSPTHVALLERRVLTRSGRSYTTNYAYSTVPYNSSRPNNFNDFGRANLISETGDSARTTSRTFFYGSSNDPSFGTYIVDKTASETVQVGSESFTRSYTYTASTGFKTSETIYGITTTYVAHSSGSGNVGRATDANNNFTLYSYSWGVPSLIQTPNYTISRSINTDGTIAWETRRGFTTTFTYDALSRPTQTAPPVGNAINTAYDNTGGASVTVTRGLSSLVTSLDGFGRSIGTQNGVGIKTALTYNACGRTIFESYPFVGSPNPVPGTKYLYDPIGRLTQRTNPDNSFVTYTYSLGVDVSINDEEKRLTKQDWSAFGDPGDARLMRLTDANNGVTQYAFNAVGSLRSVILPGGGPTRIWTYNSRNELVDEFHPENGHTLYAYDPAGNLKTRTDAQFGTTMFSYDGNNRLIGIDRPGSAYDTAMGYDASDNRTLLETADIFSAFAYDPANRLVSRTDDLDGLVWSIGYTYDANDNLDRLTYPSGAVVDYDYDTENRITRVKSGAGATYAELFIYHPSGALTSYRAGNGLIHNFTYDTRYRLKTLNVGNAPRLTYGYDLVSNVTSIQDIRPGFSANFTLDVLDRLKTVTGTMGNPKFSYSPTGNRLSKQVDAATTNYTYDTVSQLLLAATGAEVESFTYDLNGNLKADGSGSYAYAPTNLLVNANVGGSSTSYLYDGDDLRKARIAAVGSSYFVHGPGGQLLGEYKDNAGSLETVREYVLAGTRLIAEVVPTGLAVAPAALSFIVVLDEGAPNTQTLTLTTNGQSIPWTATTSAPWLKASPGSGPSTPATVSVSIDPSTLTPGTYSGSVTVSSPGASNSPVAVPVQVMVFATASLYLSPTSVSFYQPAGGPDPQPAAVQVLYTSGSGVDWQATTGDAWILISPSGGYTPDVLNIQVLGAGLAPGTHHGSVTVDSLTHPGNPQTLAVEFVIGPGPGTACATDASYCEIFDDEPLGDLDAGWIWSEPNVPQVVADPRGVGKVMLLDPPPGARLNGDVNLASPHAISGTEISVQVMTTGTNPADSRSLAKIEFYTEAGKAWGKTTRTFGTIRFGSNLRFQYGQALYKWLVNPMQPGRWYAVKVRYVGGQTEVYVDGDLKFTTPAPDPALQLQAFSLTAWDLAPGAAYADLLEARPPELVVDPMALSLQSSPGGGFDCGGDPDPGSADKNSGRVNSSAPVPGAARRRPAKPEAVRLPVAFEANVGQADPSVRFLARGPGHLLMVRPRDLIMAVAEPRPNEERGRAPALREVKLSLIRMGLRGARKSATVRGVDAQPAQSHYLTRHAQAQTEPLHAPRFGRVVSQSVYPGVDLVLHGERGRIEYDLVLAPGADAIQIELEFEGAKSLRIAENGDLVITAPRGREVRQPRPLAYQEVDGTRRIVAGRYALRGPRNIGFELGVYDRALPLVIDPVVAWTAQFGGLNVDDPYDIASDGDGAVYVTGKTLSSDFPLLDPLQSELAGTSDAFVTKLAADGSMVYSSYLGGSGSDGGYGIAVNAQEEVVIAGSTSGGFPVTNAPVFGTGGQADAFIARVSANGALLLNSTTLGGSGNDVLHGLALDGAGNIFVAGDTVSFDFPQEPSSPIAKKGVQDGFVTSISADFQQLRFSNYLGGNEINWGESASGMAVSPIDGSVYVVGYTDAPDFPGSTNCGAAPQDAFVARLNSVGAVGASRCHGGSGVDVALDVTLTPDVVVVGSTQSPDFPDVQALQPFGGGASDAFVASFQEDLSSVVFSSPLGGSDQDSATAVSTDANGGEAYVTGWTLSADFPAVSPTSCGNKSYANAFLMKLNAIMALEYSTLLDDDEHGGQFPTGVAAHGSGVYLSWLEAQDAFVGSVLDQASLGTVQFAVTTANADEGDVVSAEVQREGGQAGTLVVSYETADGTATAPFDYDGTPGSLILDDKSCSAEIQVPVYADGQVEANETFTLALTGVTGDATVGSPSSLLGIICDGDGGGGGGGGGDTAQFTISHRSQPTGPTWQATVDVPWLSLDASSGVGPSTVTVVANATGLSDGTYTGRITITTTDATGSPQDIAVTLVVTSLP